VCGADRRGARGLRGFLPRTGFLRRTGFLPRTGRLPQTDGMSATLYRGGAVYSPADPFATAMLVVGDTVAWVGSDDAATAQGAAADVVDLDGALVTPAFVDAHVHTTETGLALEGLDLSAARSATDVLAAVEAAGRSGRGRPVLGHGWDETGWDDPRLPTRQELDRAAAGGAVFLSRTDGHSALVSSALAQQAGLRDLDGWDAAGPVQRAAHRAAREVTRPVSPRRRRELQRRALQAAADAGIGCVHEMSAAHIAPADDLHDLLALVAQEPLPQVVGYRGELAADEASARALLRQLPEGTAGLAGDLCVDGSIGSRTAAWREPYADVPGSGRLDLDSAAVAAHLAACTRAGVQGGFHAIGDAAVDVVVRGLEQAAADVGAAALRSARHRVEHAEAVDPAAVTAFAAFGVTASVQPAFDARWGGPGGAYARRLGADRAAALNPLAALAAAGVPLAFGSDAPVTALDPWGAVRAAAFASRPEHRMSARAAFLAHTRGGWRAAGRDGMGVLAPGAAATFAVWSAGDLVVQAPDGRVQAWSTDVRSGTPGLPDLTPGRPLPRCLRTVVAGRVVSDRGALPASSSSGR
jgi:predicted amidohydrolase YtcJ